MLPPIFSWLISPILLWNILYDFKNYLSDQNVLVVLLHFFANVQNHKTVKQSWKWDFAKHSVFMVWKLWFCAKKSSLAFKVQFVYFEFLQENVLGRNGELLFTTRNLTIFNIIRWLAGSMGRTTHRPSVWCSKYYFFFIISCKILCKKSFQFIFLFFYNFTKIKIKSFKCPKSIRNYEKQ